MSPRSCKRRRAELGRTPLRQMFREPDLEMKWGRKLSALAMKYFSGRGWATADSSVASPLATVIHSMRLAQEASTYWDHIFRYGICMIDCAQ